VGNYEGSRKAFEVTKRMNADNDSVPVWLADAIDWRALLTHLELSQGFSFVVILAPSENIAEICRVALEAELAIQEKTMRAISVRTTRDLEQLAGKLVSDVVGEVRNLACVWVAHVVSQDASDYAAWRDAWRVAVSRLNQFRNPLSRQLAATLAFVGAPWLKEVLRQDAPDLWSIRSLVAVIEPGIDRAASLDFSVESTRDVGPAPDPELALRYFAPEISSSRTTRIGLLLRAAQGFLEQRQLDRSASCLQEALELSQDQKEDEQLAETYFLFAQIELESRRFAEGEAHLLRCLAIYQRLGLSGGMAASYHLLGIVAQNRKDFGTARECYLNALAIDERVGNVHGAASSYHQLGRIAEEQRDFETAREWYLKSLAISEKQGNLHAAAGAYHQLGRIAEEQRDFETAREWYTKSLALSEKQGNLHGAAITYHQLGRIAEEQRDFETALEWYLKSLAIEEKQGNLHGAASTYNQLGMIAAKQGEMASCAGWFIRSIQKFLRSDDERLASQAKQNLFISYTQASEEQQIQMKDLWDQANLGPFPTE
jgi:tetratricopeptide (TPR) repeat protein